MEMAYLSYLKWTCGRIYITVQISKDVMILLTIFIYEIVKKVSLL